MPSRPLSIPRFPAMQVPAFRGLSQELKTEIALALESNSYPPGEVSRVTLSYTGRPPFCSLAQCLPCTAA